VGQFEIPPLFSQFIILRERKMESDIITSSYNVEVSEMPYLPCTGCKKTLEISIGGAGNVPSNHSNPSKLIGSAICRVCGAGTGFQIVDNVIAYVSGESSYGKLNAGLTGDIKMLYAEAELCFQNGVPDAAVAMCRASIELTLNRAGFKGNNLFELIEDAGEAKKLDKIEVGLAHSSRLTTRDAIHRGEFVSLADVPSMLSATVKILNKLSSNINSPT
jgi:hypothetical protein